MEWADWIQQVGKQALDTAIEVKYKQPYEIQKMQMAAMGPFGFPYVEGTPAGGAQPVANVGGIPTTWLIVGALVAVVALVD